MSAAICSRVTGLSGAKIPSPMPLTMPFFAPHSTKGAYHVPGRTSEKDVPG